MSTFYAFKIKKYVAIIGIAIGKAPNEDHFYSFKNRNIVANN